MNARIQQIIDEIKAKSLSMHVVLQNERAKSLNQQLEIDRLKVELDDLKINHGDVLSQVNLLQAQLEETKGQVVSGSDVPKRNNEEIDELVKEIEYCINQLRK
jgi:RNase H-fold protein (predicted Holliday junction resolvase)